MHLAAILLLLTTTLFPNPTQSLYLRPLPHAPNTKAPRAVVLDWDDAPIVKRDTLPSPAIASSSPSQSPTILPSPAAVPPKRGAPSPPEEDLATRQTDANTPIPNADTTNTNDILTRRTLPDEESLPNPASTPPTTAAPQDDSPEAIYARQLATYNAALAARAEWDRVQGAIARISSRAPAGDDDDDDEGLDGQREGQGGREDEKEDALMGSEEVWRRDLLRRLALLEGRGGEEMEEGGKEREEAEGVGVGMGG